MSRNFINSTFAIFRRQFPISIGFWIIMLGWPAWEQDANSQSEEPILKADLLAISEILDTFYQNPTQERLNHLAGLLEKQKQKLSRRSKFGALSAVAMGRACQTFDLNIVGDAPVLDFAREIASDDIDEELYAMFGVEPESDIRQVSFWLYSFTGSGELGYIDELIAIAGNYNSNEFDTDEARNIAMSADTLMLRLAKAHPTVLEHLKISVELDQWRLKKSLLKRYIAYATTGWDEGEAFDRNSPEGTLRLFFYGMMIQDASLVAATSDPISADDMKLLVQGNEAPPNIDFKKLATTSPITRLKAGQVWRAGKTEIEVQPEEASDRAMVAYLGPAMGPPFFVYKIGGVWQVQSSTVITVRKSAKKLTERRRQK